MDRRKFIRAAGLVLPLAGALPASALTTIKTAESETANTDQRQKADYTIRIGTGLIEVGRSILFRPLLITGNFRGRFYALKKGNRP